MNNHFNSPKLVRYSKELRKNMTPQERRLWYDYLKKLPLTVKRQKPLLDYIADFFIYEKSTVIELDGRQHYTEEHREADRIRDSRLRSIGVTVLRYKNTDIDCHFESVCRDIGRHLGLFTDSPY